MFPTGSVLFLTSHPLTHFLPLFDRIRYTNREIISTHDRIAISVTGFQMLILSLSSAHSTVPTAPSTSSIRHAHTQQAPPHTDGFTDANDTFSYWNSVTNPRIAASPSCTVFYR